MAQGTLTVSMYSLQFYKFGFKCLTTYKNNIFSLLVKSSLVKLETSCTVILPPMVSVLWVKLRRCPILLFISSSPEPKIVDSSFDERKKGEGISVTIFSEILLLLQKFKSLGQFLRIDLVFCKILNLL